MLRLPLVLSKINLCKHVLETQCLRLHTKQSTTTQLKHYLVHQTCFIPFLGFIHKTVNNNNNTTEALLGSSNVFLLISTATYFHRMAFSLALYLAFPFIQTTCTPAVVGGVGIFTCSIRLIQQAWWQVSKKQKLKKNVSYFWVPCIAGGIFHYGI